MSAITRYTAKLINQCRLNNSTFNLLKQEEYLFFNSSHIPLTQKYFIMADDESIAKNRPKRGAAAKAAATNAAAAAATTPESPKEDPPKRSRLVYDSLEHCRATRKPKSKSKDSNKVGESSKKSEEEEEEDGVETMEYIESLKSKSSSGPRGRFHDTNLDGKRYNLKITTWNINGLRNWLSKRSGLTFIASDDADIYCFQEIKCPNSKIPAEIKNVPGYNCFWHGSDDAYSGVVCFTKKQPKNVTYGIGVEEFDKEPRVITMEFDKYYVVNVYVPNSGRGLVKLDVRMKWDIEFRNFLKDLDSKKPTIVAGDLNVSHTEIDLANPKTNVKTAGFTVGERQNLTRLLEQANLVDVYRHLNPDKTGVYTFWTYMRNAREKNIGWRLDYFLLSKRWIKKVCDCIIQAEVFGSDHCPVSIFLSI